MAYTYITYIDALKAATTNLNLTDIRTLMQTDMSNAGLAADSVDQVNFWLDQIDNAATFNRNFELMDNAGSLFTILMGLVPPESTDTYYFNGPVVIDPGVSTTGAITTLTVTNPLNTGQTASTEIPSVLITTTGREWATGAITTQREVNITAPTYSFVAASTITNAYTLYAAAPIAGTNATITNDWALGLSGNAQINGTVLIGNASGSATTQLDIHKTSGNAGSIIITDDTAGVASTYVQADSVLYFAGLVNVGSTFAGSGLLIANSAALDITSPQSLITNVKSGGSIIFTLGGRASTNEMMRFATDGSTIFKGLGATTGLVTAYTFTKPSYTGQTASTEANGFLFTSGTRQWATGAITTQREFKITAPTYSFVGASTITTAYTFFVDPPTAGTNATITNNYAAGFNGHIGVLSSIQLGSVTTLVTSTFLQFAASTTAKSLMNLAVGAAPTAPVDGDVWREDNTNTGLKIRINGVTKTIVVA